MQASQTNSQSEALGRAAIATLTLQVAQMESKNIQQTRTHCSKTSLGVYSRRLRAQRPLEGWSRECTQAQDKTHHRPAHTNLAYFTRGHLF
jgi:hypothetical protein